MTKDMGSEKQVVDKRTKRTKAAIEKAFIELAEEKGLGKVTVSEIAARADINRKTFYHHYESIDMLIDEILEEEAKSAASSIRESLLDENGEIDIMQLFQVLSLKISETAHRNAAVLAGVDTEKFIRHFEPVLMRVASEHIPEIYGDASKEQMRYLITFIFSGLISTYHRWVADDSELEMKQLADILSVLVTTGLAGFREYSQAKASGVPVETPSGLPFGCLQVGRF